MKSIYILSAIIDYEGSTIIRAYESKVDAQKQLEKIKAWEKNYLAIDLKEWLKKHPEKEHSQYYDRYTLEEVDLMMERKVGGLW